ncbi:single-stranded-DNA-specific exonuclease RecJ [Candidatus Nomurabacteria bacterium]|nr:single-stranded-DNA-specific exonuclease RecJ [Candidatus Kaiserbacteria bacterium]MCB9814603.1 single-stranded-DNA-specific exonuclease RecJ [Candidatus Nomurabacteria bacterium]
MKTYQFPNSNKNYSDTEPTASPLLNQLLSARGITKIKEAEDFLNPDYETQLHLPELLNDMEKARKRIESAMEAGEKIAIFSDYDCDGIPGAVVLHDFFKAVKYNSFQNYIPHRHYEGFGLSNKAIDTLQADGVTLIITIDCGTSNVAAVAYAKEQGIDVIVTDHHEPEVVLPEAVAVVNPKLGGYPFADLCGTGVVFKLVQSLLNNKDYGVKKGFEKWWLDMVAIATVADMVPLQGENRVLAYYGLQVLRKSRRPGLQQLLKKAKADQRYLTEDDIGFTIGPRINAASRMDTPEDAFHMLSETDLVKASERVEHLERLNTDRKSMVALMTKDLHKRMKTLEEIPAVVVMGNPEWRPSLVGLAANKLAEELGRPVFLWGTDGNGVYKGSCRSGGGISVVKLMQATAEVFLEYGGHHVAGGFSVKDKDIFTFGTVLTKAAEELGEEALIKEDIVIDAEIQLADINPLLIEQLNKLSPFGTGNHKPLFAFMEVTPESVELFGKTKEHTKLMFQTEQGKIEAIAFFQTPEQFTKLPVAGETCTMIGHVEQSYFMNRMQTRVRIVDVL